MNNADVRGQSSFVGVDLNDLHRSVKISLHVAADMGFRVAEISAASGELTPEQLSASGRRHLSRLTEGLGISLAALVADMPGLRLTDPKTVDERISRTLAILDLSRDLRVPAVTASIGALTHPDSGEPSPLAVQSLQRIGEVADHRNAMFAIRPTGDSPDRILRVLEAVGCPALKLCLDPASLMMSGVNPMALVERCADGIVLIHARDATAGFPERPGHETVFGEGDVDWKSLAEVLKSMDFRHPVVLRRTDSSTPARDLLIGRDAVNQLFNPPRRIHR